MIESPDVEIYRQIAFGCLFVGLGITLFLMFKAVNFAIALLPFVIGLVVLFVVILGIVSPIQQEWNDDVKLEIDTASCSELRGLYDEYERSDVKERITDRLIIDCIVTEARN